MANLPDTATTDASPGASPADVRRRRQYPADEHAEAAVYRDLAGRRTGEEREILLALAQRAEARSPYVRDVHATDTMAADEQIHEEIVRALATRGRNRLSGSFRAAGFGANDGLVTNLSLVMGISASGASNGVVLLSGVAGLLAGALSMGAGEYVSVRSQRELLEASTPNSDAHERLPHLNVDANELALLYRARGMTPEAANAKAAETLQNPHQEQVPPPPEHDKHEAVGTGLGAATSSFLFFASGAILPVLP